jgi:hypothetical protein
LDREEGPVVPSLDAADAHPEDSREALQAQGHKAVIKPPWHIRAWRRFKESIVSFCTIVGLILSIVVISLFLLFVGVWVLLALAIVGVTAVLVALVKRM